MEIIKTHLTKHDLARAIADMLAERYHAGLGHAVGLDDDGDVARCFEGGSRLAAVIVRQATDSDSYGGGAMSPDEVDAVADAFELDWLDEYNAQHAGDIEIIWAPPTEAD